MSRSFLLIATLATGLVGCSEPAAYPVSGTVTLGVEDGAVNVGMIEFLPIEPGPSARGRITAGGAYTLSTFGDSDGAPPGDYVVVISQPQLAGTIRLAPEEHQATHETADNELGVVPRRYGQPASTDLRATVTAGENRCDFSLEIPAQE